MVADLKRDPHTPFSVLTKENLKFDLYDRFIKTTTYTSKKFEIDLFWTARESHNKLFVGKAISMDISRPG